MRWACVFWALMTGPALACDPTNSLPHTNDALLSPRVLVIGSSSTSGVGAGSIKAAYPAQIPLALRPWSIYPIVTARGIGGEKAAGALARMEREIADTKPALVLWQVGTNDATARLDPKDVAETIREGIALIRAAKADAILIDPQFYPRIANKPHYLAMADMIDRVGEELCVPVVDRFEEMRDHPELPLLLAPDKFHMSAIGHRILARSIGREIRCGLGGCPDGSQ